MWKEVPEQVENSFSLGVHSLSSGMFLDILSDSALPN